MAKVSYYTEEGYNKLKKELETLKTVDRAHVIKQIAEARDKGDLSENSEYDAAKEAQGMLEMRIAKLEGRRTHSGRFTARRIESADTIHRKDKE